MAQRTAQHVAHVQFPRLQILIIQRPIFGGNLLQLLPPRQFRAALLLGDTGKGGLLQVGIV
ncbi:hypothetical protein D3C81_2063340 [compost metagenome]